MGKLQGKTALITGATSGIGLEAAVKLADMGATVVLVGRNQARLDASIAQVKERGKSKEVSGLLCDFEELAQIRALATAFKEKHDKLHILVNNAGLVSDTRRLSKDGYELTFAVNHLGYFLLTTLLLDVMVASAPARIVNVASAGHRRGDMNFDDLMMEKDYFIMKAYGRSKLGNILFTRELAERLKDKGITVNAVHPGGVATNIWTGAPWYGKPLIAVAKLFMATPEQGGDTIVNLAAGDEVQGKTGGYYNRMKLEEPSALALDAELARKLWARSEELTTPR
jgi:NAD(P)-dependent dehydrogenase (short-subunit alcohol dehydrogenase family)